MRDRPIPTFVVFGLSAGLVVVLAGTATGCGVSKGSDGKSPSASATHTPKPGALAGQNLKMHNPVGKNKVSYVTGQILNAGPDGEIVKADSPVAKSVSLMNGTQVVSGIPIINGTQTGDTSTLSRSGYHLRLNMVNVADDNDGIITVNLIASNGASSPVNVKIIGLIPTPKASSSATKTS